jgi:hypothetical protein
MPHMSIARRQKEKKKKKDLSTRQFFIHVAAVSHSTPRPDGRSIEFQFT